MSITYISSESKDSGQSLPDMITSHVDRRINTHKLRRVLCELIEIHGAPEHIRSDNGSEFMERDLCAWLAKNQIRALYIDPGSPWQNG